MSQAPEAASTADPEATFRAFYRREYAEAVGLASIVSGSRVGAERLTTEVFAAFGRHARRGAPTPTTAAVHHAVASAALSPRRRHRATRRASRGSAPAVSPLPETPAQTWAAVRRLPRDQLLAVTLTFYSDVPVDHLASTLGKPTAAVESDLRTALGALGHSLAVGIEEVSERLRDASDAARDATAGIPRTADWPEPRRRSRGLFGAAALVVAAAVAATTPLWWPDTQERHTLPVAAATAAVAAEAGARSLEIQLQAAGDQLDAIARRRSALDAARLAVEARYRVVAFGTLPDANPEVLDELVDLERRIIAVGSRRQDVQVSFDEIDAELHEVRTLLDVRDAVAAPLPAEVDRSVETLDLKLTVLETQHDLLALEIEAVDSALDAVVAATSSPADG